QLRAEVADAGLAERVSFHGPIPPQRMHEWYRAADLLIVPSRVETWGMVITEALAHQIPVVASDTGGLPEALGRAPDGSLPGILVTPGDQHALADALDQWLGEPAIRTRLRASVRARHRALPRWHHTAEQVAATLDDVARDARAQEMGKP